MKIIRFLPPKEPIPFRVDLDEHKKYMEKIPECPLCKMGVPVKKYYPKKSRKKSWQISF